MQPLNVIESGRRPNTTTIRELAWYDYYLVSFSGGKDSVALVLELIRRGADRSKIVLMHQHIDGDPTADAPFMDWPCTASYCRAFAEALGLRILFQWREGGFEKELTKEDAKTAAVRFELLAGGIGQAGGVRGKVSTRRMFPQVTADLSKRWCSASLKIDVAATAICNDPAFDGKKILYLSGERRQESAARSRYAEAEQHRTHSSKRHVDHWRLVIDWTEEQVWEIMKDFGIVPHPAYRMGWGRVSCMCCIFGQADQWASVRQIAKAFFDRVACYEMEFGKTIKQGTTVQKLADQGTPYAGCQNAALVALALTKDYPADQIVTTSWTRPEGAYRACGGPV